MIRVALSRSFSTTSALRTLERSVLVPLSQVPANDGDFITVPHKEGSSPILLTRSNGQLFATSSTCTHYGAPLGKGVISKDGRIVCPWHGASFDAKTGEPCEGPALDGLTSYSVSIEYDHVVITNKEKKPHYGSVSSLTNHNPKDLRIAIVGGGAATMGAIQVLVDRQFEGSVDVYTQESQSVPIDRTKLSKIAPAASDFKVASLFLKPEAYFQSNRVKFIKSSVQEISSNKLVLADGKSSDAYDSILVATGSTPKVLNIEGASLDGVFTLRGVNDFLNISKALDKTRFKEAYIPKVAVVGSSFIGMELASALSKTNQVTVISNEKTPFSNSLGTEIGEALKKLHESQNVKFKLGASIQKFTGNKSASTVVLSDGPVEADAIILGTGVAPNTEFIQGKYLDKSHRVKVDQYLKLDDNLYAAGDITSYPYHLSGEQVSIEHWDVAIQQGRVAAKNILADLGLSEKKEVFTNVPYFWTSQFGKSLRLSGHSAGYTSVSIEGNLEKLEFVAYYMKGEKVIALASMNKDPAVSKFYDLYRRQSSPLTLSQVKAL